jgi:hypothetical protein
LKKPDRRKLRDCPEERETLVGVIEIEVKLDAVTVTIVEPLKALAVALMVTLPVATPFTKPVALTVATDASEVVQLDPSVMDCLLPSS